MDTLRRRVLDTAQGRGCIISSDVSCGPHSGSELRGGGAEHWGNWGASVGELHGVSTQVPTVQSYRYWVLLEGHWGPFLLDHTRG